MDILTFLVGFFTVSISLIVYLIIFFRMGGWPEAHYRFWGISYFRQCIFEEDGNLGTWILRTDRIHHASAPSFKNAGGEWLIDPENDGRYHGRPSRYWNRGDSRQIPIFTWTKKEERWDMELIKAAYDDDSIERARALGRKIPFPIEWILVAVAIVAVISIVSVYYSHDTYCALKPAMC